MALAPVPGLPILGMFSIQTDLFILRWQMTVNPIYEFTVNMHDSLAFILTSLVSMTGQISVSGSSNLLPLRFNIHSRSSFELQGLSHIS